MSDENENKPTLGRRPLGLKPRIESGEVKQTFSHGRTNKVVVEVKRKKLVGKPGYTPEAEVAAPPPPPPPPPPRHHPRRRRLQLRPPVRLFQAEKPRRSALRACSVRPRKIVCVLPKKPIAANRKSASAQPRKNGVVRKRIAVKRQKAPRLLPKLRQRLRPSKRLPLTSLPPPKPGRLRRRRRAALHPWNRRSARLLRWSASAKKRKRYRTSRAAIARRTIAASQAS